MPPQTDQRNKGTALTGWGKGGNVTFAGWQVTLCDPIWQVVRHVCELVYSYSHLLYFTVSVQTTRS